MSFGIALDDTGDGEVDVMRFGLFGRRTPTHEGRILNEMKRCLLFSFLLSGRNFPRLHAAKLGAFVVVAFAIVTVAAYAGSEHTDLSFVENQGRDSFDYRGFHVELSGVDSPQDLSSLQGMIRQQIDIVERSGLPPETLAFFRRFPVMADADGSAGLGHYSGGESVSIGAVAHLDGRPILLHEYMHLFHHRMMPLGERNPDILKYYTQAIKAHLYPEGSYVLSNHKEYFAMTASLFLNGWIARPPFTKENLKYKQPAYYEFLERLLMHSR